MYFNYEILVNSNGIMTGKPLPITGGRAHNPNVSKILKKGSASRHGFSDYLSISLTDPASNKYMLPFCNLGFSLLFKWYDNIGDWLMGFYIQLRQVHRLATCNLVLPLCGNLVLSSSKMDLKYSPK